MSIEEEAIAKLTDEFGKAKLDKYGNVVGKPVLEALVAFCKQNSEFSQAVMQSDKTIGECISAATHGVTTALSDIETYRRAVNFYFPGAEIRFTMTIDLGDNGFSNAPAEPPKSTGLQLSLDELLGL